MKIKTSIYILLCLIWTSCESKQTPAKQVESTLIETEKKSTEAAKKDEKKKILFFGDSLTAGYQLNEEESFPSLIQNRIDSLNLDYTVINAGLSGETTSGGLNRIDWVLRQPFDIFVLELGANDALRGLDLTNSKRNLEQIVEKVKAKYPEVKLVIAGMMAPPNLGTEYAKDFNALFTNIAQKYKAELIPFLLDGVAGSPELNLKDGIHPNAKGQYVVRENVWKVLSKVL